MRKGALLITLLILSTGFAKSYYYETINLNVTVQENGDLKVVEQETLVFDGSFSYVYREFNSPVSDFRVSGELQHYEKEGNKYTWHGSWNDTTKKFTLEYIIKDPFEIRQEYDRLWYTIVFRDRSVPVNNAEAYFQFPNPINTTNYQSNKGIITQLSSTEIIVKANSLPANTALDFEIILPKGVIKPPLSWKNIVTLYPRVISISYSLLFIIPLILTIKGFKNYYNQKKEKEKSEVVYQKVRVKDYPPAIAGLLIDYKLSIKEVTATIIDLAVRGYIYIHKIVKPLWPDETKLIKVKNNLKQLNNYEKKIMKTIFNKGKEASFNQLKHKFVPLGKKYTSSPLYRILKSMKQEMTKLELSKKSIDTLIKEKAFKVTLPVAIGLGLTVILGLIGYYLINREGILIYATTGFQLLVSITSIIILSILSTKLVKLSAKGENAKKTYNALKKFIKEQPLTEGRLFDTYLPYAIALGVQKKWVKKAAEIGYDSTKSSWHSSNITTLGIISLSSNLNSSVTPSRSSGSGRGGFGGGGGAGGGGGGAG